MAPSLKKITLELIQRCPNRCVHCSSNSSPSAKNRLDFSQALSLVDQAHELGAKKVILSGGEPLIYADLIPLVRHIRTLGMSVVIYTCGSVMGRNGAPTHVPDDLITRLHEFDVNRFNLSLHSHRPSTHDRFMQVPGSWGRANALLRHLLERGIEVHVHAVLTKYNHAHLLEFAEYLDGLGLSTIRFLRLVRQGRARYHWDSLRLSEVEWLVVTQQLNAIAESSFRALTVRLGAHLDGVVGPTGYECSLDSDKLLVEPNGVVAVCPALKGASDSLGAPSVHDHSLMQILDSCWRVGVARLKQQSSEGECPAQTLYQIGLTGQREYQNEYR